MGLNDISDPRCVLQAIAEFDVIGREAFLEKYGFGRSTRYVVEHNGQVYDSKAILSAAHEYQTGNPLPHTDFSGGAATTVRKLESLGFRVVEAAGSSLTVEDVEAALDRFDEIGREAFLAEYGGSKASKFFLIARGGRYDAKAVLVTAMRRLPQNRDLRHDGVDSTLSAVSVPLTNLGYKVVGEQVDRKTGTTVNEISRLIETILDHQTKYNSSIKDPVMVQRRSDLEELNRLLVSECGPSFGWPGGGKWVLSGDVSLGAGFTPKVPWARLTDRSISPSATAGWYVVLLFAADGSSCVMSLNQGTTSVTGTDKNRQIRSRAHQAFSYLDDSPTEGPGRGWAPFGGAPVSRLAGEPDLRGGALGRSYELGHVDGVVYKKGAVPADSEIIAHANALLSMLGRLYDKENGTVTQASPTHVLLRWSENQANGHDTIAEHRAVLQNSGKVVWAKFGSPLGDGKIDELNAQIQAGDVTHAFLVGGTSPKMFRATVTSIDKGTASVDRTLVPAYYRDNLTGNETCFTFGQIEETDLYPQLDDLLFLVSNPEKKPSESLRSQVTVFYVKEKVPRAPAPAVGSVHGITSRMVEVAEKLNIGVDEVQKLINGVSGKKRQMILMGPPGTGKTYVAQQIAPLLVEDESHIRLVQFHPSYGYEDFIEGLRPVPGANGGFEFVRVPGVLVELAEAISGNDTEDGDGETRVLIIDEINRANISKVFGELMFLLEYRDQSMKLMLDNRQFHLPDNLIIIGTMNTADRSIRTLDVAMRRRFRFFELPPRSDVVSRHYAKPENSNELGAELISGFEKLNAKLTEEVDRHHTIGHSYILHSRMTADLLREVWEQEIFPLIEDYFFDRPDSAVEYDIKAFWPSV